MSIHVYCPWCDSTYDVVDDLAGTWVQCTRCPGKLLVPGNDEVDLPGSDEPLHPIRLRGRNTPPAWLDEDDNPAERRVGRWGLALCLLLALASMILAVLQGVEQALTGGTNPTGMAGGFALMPAPPPPPPPSPPPLALSKARNPQQMLPVDVPTAVMRLRQSLIWPREQAIACEELRKLAPHAREAIPDLLPLTISADQEIRENARRAIASNDPEWATDANLRFAYNEVLKKIHTEAFHGPSVVTLAKHFDPQGTKTVPVLVGKLVRVAEAEQREILETLPLLDPQWQGRLAVLARVDAWVNPESRQPVDSQSLLTVLKAIGPEVIPTLVNRLGGTNTSILEETLVGFGAASVPRLSDCLCDQADLKRRAAARAMQKLGPLALPAVSRLIDGLTDRNVENRDVFFLALASVDREWARHPRAQTLLPQLIEAVTDRDEPQPWQAIRLLGQFGGEAKSAVPALIAHLAEARPTGAMAREALTRIDPRWLERPEATRALVGLIERVARGPSPAGRDPIEAIRQFGPDFSAAKKALPVLIRAASRIQCGNLLEVVTLLNQLDPTWPRRPESVEAMQAIAKRLEMAPGIGAMALDPAFALDLNEYTLPVLVRLLANPRIRKTVEQRLRWKDSRWASHPAVQKTIPVLVVSLKDESIDTRCLTLAALGIIGSHAWSAVPAMRACLRDESPVVARCAAMNLAEIGPSAREAIPEIRQLLEMETNPQVRGILEAALIRIEKPELIQEAPREIGPPPARE